MRNLLLGLIFVFSPFTILTGADQTPHVDASYRCAANTDKSKKDGLAIAPTSQPQVSSDRVNERLDAQDRRISDIWSSLNLFGIVATIFGVLITAVVVFFSLKTSSSAIAEARHQANLEIEKWLSLNADRIVKIEIQRVIVPAVDLATKEIRDAAKPYLVELDRELKKTTELNSKAIADREAVRANAPSPVEEDVSDHPTAQVAATRGDLSGVGTVTAIPGPTSRPFARDREQNKERRARIRSIRKLRSEKRYSEALAALEEIEEELKGSEVPEDITYVLEAVEFAAAIYKKLEKYDRAIEKLNLVVERYYLVEDASVRVALASALVAQAQIYESARDYQQAIGVFDRILSMPDVNLRDKAQALDGKARCLDKMGRRLEALEITDHLIHYFWTKQDDSPGRSGIWVTWTMTNAYLRKARILEEMGRMEDAEQTYKTAVEYVGSHTSTPGFFARIQNAQGSFFIRANKLQSALTSFGAVIAQYATGEHMVPEGAVMTALLQKAAILSLLGLYDEEMRVYEEVAKIWRESDKDGYFAEYAAAASVNKAITLAKLARNDEALQVIEQTMAEFGSSSEAGIVEQITKAAKLQLLLKK